MTRRRSIVLAAQAVVVGVLTVVVFATLLRPEDTNPLLGITTPGGPEVSGLPRPGSYTGDGEQGDRRETRPEADRTTGGLAGSGALGPAGPSTPEVPPPPPTGPVDEGDPGSPSDEQYADTLTRLEARLN